MNVSKVVLADDHPALRVGIKGMLEKAGIEVVGEAADGDEALRLAERLGPDVLVGEVLRGLLNLGAKQELPPLQAGVLHQPLPSLDFRCARRDSNSQPSVS